MRVKGATRPLAWGRWCRCRQWPLSQMTANSDFTQSKRTVGSAGGQTQGVGRAGPSGGSRDPRFLGFPCLWRPHIPQPVVPTSGFRASAVSSSHLTSHHSNLLPPTFNQ